MRTNRRIFLSFCALIFCALTLGLLVRPALRPATATPARQAAAKVKAKKPSAPSVGVVSTDGTATLPDPKRPGKLLYELRYKSASGQSGDAGAYGTLTTVWAKLFQQGIASATLTAPQAQVSNAGKSVVVTGLGGVTVQSLTQPGTKMTADTVVWTAGLNRIIASGHVVYRDGKTGLVLTGPRMNFDTRLKSFQMGRGHGTLNQ